MSCCHKGYDVFETDDDKLVLQKCDELELFKSDRDAAKQAILDAAAGDAEALRIVLSALLQEAQ